MACPSPFGRTPKAYLANKRVTVLTIVSYSSAGTDRMSLFTKYGILYSASISVSATFRSCIMVSLTRKQQELYKHIQNIAAQFPPSLVSRYTAAAKEFRAPYWDWALGKKGGQVPELIVSPTTQVTDVDGIKKTIPNPLASYQFHPLIPEDFSREVRLTFMQ